MVLNRCRDIVISMRQKPPEDEELEARSRYLERVGWDVFYPDPFKQPRPVPFAWDEPYKGNTVQVSGTAGEQEAVRPGARIRALLLLMVQRRQVGGIAKGKGHETAYQLQISA